jgi:hypothetical protein
MATVGRLAGAILLETEGRFLLVGNPKRPCDWAKAGFASPGVVDAMKQPYIELEATGAVKMDPPYLGFTAEGEPLAKELAARLLIERNASVSERLLGLVLGGDDADDERGADRDEPFAAQWLVDMPGVVWGVVRDTVLRCT